MLPGFVAQRISVTDADIHVLTGGSGPPLLLLHGYPQTHAMWHRMAPQLAERFTVVCPDLRGYGDSAKPEGGAGHVNYSKRAMARDQVEVMRALGFERFDVAGHDRGGRVAHRMALDHPGSVRRLAVLDIAPTRLMFAQTNQAFATAYYHWFFLIQPFDLPERLIGADPRFFLRWTLGGWGSKLDHFDPRALAEYERCFANPATIQATCEDYRAAASIDLDHDQGDAHSKLACPLLVIWGAKGVVQRLFHPLADWKGVADDVRGGALPAGHYLPEEAPAPTLAALQKFFSDSPR
ncbi:MAG: alpha/beta hydrolase [Casimicrobiaceae bacterium]